jgi:hypothetical protein
MAFYRGQQGTVKFDKDAAGAALGEVAAVRSWSLSVEKEQLEVTDHGDTFRAYVGGLVGGSGTVEMLYDAPSAGDKLDLILLTPTLSCISMKLATKRSALQH